MHVELAPAREREVAAVVSLRGEHDLATASAVSEAISAIAGNVLIDLSECTLELVRMRDVIVVHEARPGLDVER